MAGQYSTNVRQSKRSYTEPRAGDVFSYQMPNNRYYFGRVIFANVARGKGPFPGTNLLYFYRWSAELAEPDLNELMPTSLLIPPVWTNRKSWTLGYYRTVLNVPLVPANLLKHHCFEMSMPRFGKHYVDLDGQYFDQKTEPCGHWGLVSFRYIDDRVSEALGIPVAPLDA